MQPVHTFGSLSLLVDIIIVVAAVIEPPLVLIGAKLAQAIRLNEKLWLRK